MKYTHTLFGKMSLPPCQIWAQMQALWKLPIDTLYILSPLSLISKVDQNQLLVKHFYTLHLLTWSDPKIINVIHDWYGTKLSVNSLITKIETETQHNTPGNTIGWKFSDWTLFNKTKQIDAIMLILTGSSGTHVVQLISSNITFGSVVKITT